MHLHSGEQHVHAPVTPMEFRPDMRLRFLGLWLGQPTVIAAPIPSSDRLARAMASQVDMASAGRIVELGGGTGVITAALLDRGIHPDRLVVVEANPELHCWLQTQFPGVCILCGNAFRLRGLLRKNGLWESGTACTVVSGLPVLPQSRTMKHRLLGDCFELLGPQGTFVQFTYGPTAPIGPELLAARSLQTRRVDFVWRNFPPASVWCVMRHHLQQAA